MPSKLKTPCRYPGCPRSCRTPFCEAHAGMRRARPAGKRRGSASQRGYDRTWQRLRRMHLRRQPLCEECRQDGVANAVNLEVDHVIPIRVRPDLRLAMDNLRTLCRRHHKRKSDEDRRKYG